MGLLPRAGHESGGGASRFTSGPTAAGPAGTPPQHCTEPEPRWSSPTPLSPIVVVGVDGTCSGRAALRLGAELVRSRGGGMLGVHVARRPPALWAMSADLIARAPQWRTDIEAEAFFDTGAAAELAGVDWAFALDSGDVAEALVRQAHRHKAAVVVVGANALHHWAHRCPARRILTTSDLPVLIAPARPTQDTNQP